MSHTARVILLAVAIGLCCAAPAGGQEQEPDGIAVEIRAVAAVVPVKSDARARRAYAKLIPRGLGWPTKPEVAIWLSELSVPRSAPGRPPDDASHWLEGAIDIRVRRGKVEGWYPVHYPVTAEFWWQAGRAVGLPKRRADASIVPAGNGWRATATPRGTGRPSYVLDWKPDPKAPAVAVQRAFRLPTAPMFPLNAAFEGPDLMRVQYYLRPPYPAQTALPGSAPAYSASARGQRGRVRVRMLADLDPVNEDLPRIFGSYKLADFVDLDQTVPGSHAFYALTLGSESERIGSGGYPGNAKPGGAGRPGKGPNGGNGPKGGNGSKGRYCKRKTKLVVRFRESQIGELRSARASANGTRLGTRELDGNRVRVDLSRLERPRTYRIEVVGKGTYGRSAKVRRTMRLCPAD